MVALLSLAHTPRNFPVPLGFDDSGEMSCDVPLVRDRLSGRTILPEAF